MLLLFLRLQYGNGVKEDRLAKNVDIGIISSLVALAPELDQILISAKDPPVLTNADPLQELLTPASLEIDIIVFQIGNGFDQIAIHFSDKKYAAPVNAPPLLIAGQNTASLRNQKNAVPACGVRASGRLNLIDKVQADQVAGVVVDKLTHIFELDNAPPCGSCLL